MEALIINFSIFIVIVLCLLGIKKKYFDEQEDPLFREIIHDDAKEWKVETDSNKSETMICRECGNEATDSAWKKEFMELPLEAIKLDCIVCESEQWFDRDEFQGEVNYCQPVKK